ncbi:hypothetical protein WICPIJ_008552, partial [Wickerhamomyces pijperi]
QISGSFQIFFILNQESLDLKLWNIWEHGEQRINLMGKFKVSGFLNLCEGWLDKRSIVDFSSNRCNMLS